MAVLARDCQEEGLRVALGLTLGELDVEVYLLDRPMADSGEGPVFLGALRELGIPVRTNVPGQAGLEHATEAEIARGLTACDGVLTF